MNFFENKRYKEIEKPLIHQLKVIEFKYLKIDFSFVNTVCMEKALFH
jgi:hypothetical protein